MILLIESNISEEYFNIDNKIEKKSKFSIIRLFLYFLFENIKL